VLLLLEAGGSREVVQSSVVILAASSWRREIRTRSVVLMLPTKLENSKPSRILCGSRSLIHSCGGTGSWDLVEAEVSLGLSD
jgi:hypothetical protein